MISKPRCYDGTEPYLFVSYAHKDSAAVYPIIQSMNESGLRVWYDSGIETTSDYLDFIADKIHGCSCFMAFVSKSYLNSTVSDAERKYAYKIQKKLFFVYLEDVILSPGFKMVFDNVQALFLKEHNSVNSLIEKIVSAKVLDACRNQTKQSNAELTEKFYQIGKTYYDQNNIELAVSYFRISAEMGYPDSQFFMGVCSFTENPYLKRNPAKSAKWYIKAVEQGHAGAINNLAFLYMRGWGVEKDLHLAAELFRKGVSLGNAAAASNLKACLAELSETE